jgi:membrane protease YdiL (CAAX protease family)
LASFAVWPIAIAAALQIVHGRGFGTVLGAGLWPQFRVVGAAMIVLHLALLLLPPWAMGGLEPNISLPFWLILLPVAALAVFVQVAAEELLFRGYLQQALAARVLPPVIWIGLPSLLFGLGHYDASAGSNAWLLVLWAFIFGALMADLTARAGSLGPAIAVHMANNVIALLFTGLEDSLNGLALYVYPVALSDEAALRAYLPVDFLTMVVSWLAARLALRR